MKAWSLFLKDVLVHTTGCPEPVAEHAVLRAAQEFFETTRLWKKRLIDTTTQAGATEYFLMLEPKSELVRLESAILDGRTIEVRSVDELPADWRENPNILSTGVHTEDRKTLVLLPAQAADLVLSVDASLKPADDATGIENDLFDLYVREIACGAVSMLKAHAGKTYSDPNGSLYYRGLFDNHMAGLEFRRHRGFSSARPRRQIKTF